MMKTRGRARGDAAHDAAGGSSHTTDTLQVTLPDDLDLDFLSKLLPSIPDLSRATPDVVAVLYKLVLGQNSDLDALRRDVDELNAEVERKDVELDQALQDKESLSKELEDSVESVHTELEKVKQERETLAEENHALRAQVSSLSSSQFSSTSEVDALKRSVDDIDREKRDLMGVISRLKEEGSQREEEIQTLRTNLKEARQEHQSLESQIRESKSTETSTKFKVDTLSQQLQLAHSEAERASAELNAKTEEYAKFRRTKHAETLNLQSSYDSLTQEHTSATATLKALQSAHSSQANQLTQALSKVQALTGQIAEQESKYASEANGLRRLISMMEEREKQAKEIVENIEREWATVGEKSERREDSLRQQIDRESRGREEAEKRVVHLETVIHRMGRGELPLPGTPFRTPGGPDGMMGISPTVALASKTQRGGKTFTEVYTDYVRLQEEFASKCLEHEQMERTLTHVLAEIEERAPILTQQRAEYDRVKDEAAQLSAQLSIALSDREIQAKLAQDQSQKLNKMNSENSLLQKQLGDLGRQVQGLLREIARRDDPTIPIDEDLEQVPFSPANSVDEVIDTHLVLFRNIEGLQSQNQRLLKITRELGEKMESEESEYKVVMEQEQAEAIREAHEAMQQLATQLDSQKRNSDSLIQSYVKERDALKAMLARVNTTGGQGAHFLATAPTPSFVADSEIAKELAEVQSQFEAYRNEMGVDSSRVRDELTTVQREAHELGAALAKANAKIEYLNERHRMHQEQFQLNNRELDELTKRNQGLFDQWTRVDVECNRVSEELHISNSRLEQLRNECANLRAEKNIWEGVQTRLVEENKTLAIERSHLSDLMTNIQRMHNDLELSGENDRRRLESQLQMLESQTQDLRTQLSRERDSLRHVSLQKELEAKELQGRLDKANQEVARTRESLVSAETSKKHLEERLEDLTRQLQGNQEKLGVYERRPPATASGAASSSDLDLTREQQLEQEVAELRSALKVAEVELGAARGHVQQFRDISQANEAALSNLNATFDEYRISTENQLVHRESEYKALEEKLQAANGELCQIREQYNGLKKTSEEERTAWKNDKKMLEDTIVDMTTSEKHLESDKSSREQEVRSIEERAKAAEERYSHEVVAHAESIKNIEQLKRDLAAAQTKARETQAASEISQAKLVASENSWKQQKDTLDKEIAGLNTRTQDLSSQNAILHQHLESVSSQATRIRMAAEDSSITTTGEGENSTDDSDSKLAELRSVVSYLRKEKEIVDLQLELGKQENARLKAQIDHLTQSLQEAHATISEERERAVESAASAAQHAELVERINQLNILRESNATLRADCENHAKKSRELETRLRKLSAELEPAKENARVAQAELEVCRGQNQRLEQESRSWQDRNKQLLSKYDRIDPSELQALKDQVEKHKAEAESIQKLKSELEQTLAAKQTALDEYVQKQENLEKHLKALKENGVKNNQIFRTRMGDLNQQKSALVEEKQQLEAKITQLEAAAASQTAPVPDPAVAEQVKSQEALIASLHTEKEKLLAEKDALSKQLPTQGQTNRSDAPSNWEAEKAELVKARDEAMEKLKTTTEEAEKAAAEARNVRMQNDKFQARLAAFTKARVIEKEKIEATIAEAVAKAKEQSQAGSSTAPDDIVKKHTQELANIRNLHQAELKLAVEKASQAATTAPPGDQKQAVDAALAVQKKALEEEHSKEIEAARESGRMEASMKIKLKDSQLTKAAKRVKELEAQIREWEAAGALPANSLSTIAATGSMPTIPAQHATAQKPTTPVAQKPAAAGPSAGSGTAGLPRRPIHAGGVASASAPGGIGRGGPITRGRVAPGGPGARAMPSRALPIKSAPPAAGVSIMGAAAAAAAASTSTAPPKRPREEPDTNAPDDSLAKRLKPAEPVLATGTPPPTKPVQLRRPPPGP